MRRYPAWRFAHEGVYDSVYDALLAARNLTTEALQIGAEGLHGPELLTDLTDAVERIEESIRRGDKIVVFGDYDVDGITSTALLLDCLDVCGAQADYILPVRHTDGYGIKPPGIKRALEKGAKLILTVDNGISAFEALEMAQRESVDVIVIDHHRQMQDLPPAHSIVNPNRRDCDYPFKGLAGVGVTFKVAQALTEAFLNGEERRLYLNRLLDLVALGTIADVAPILDENRVLVRHGLKAMARTRRAGLLQLMAVAKCGVDSIDATAVGFRLGPRLNSAGRLGAPDLALDLLRSGDERTAESLAQELDGLNRRRQQLQRRGAEEARGLVSSEEIEEDNILLVLGEDWNLGIIGLIASDLAETFYRPAVVCSDARRDGVYVGSARSIPPYDIIAGISSCASHLTTYGGHAGAAGFSLAADDFEAFRVDLIEHANAALTPADLQATLDVDLALRPEDIRWQTREALAAMEPFGQGNFPPVFATLDLEVLACSRVGKAAEHLKIVVDAAGRPQTAMWWRHGEQAKEVRQGDRLAIAYGLEADTYKGGQAVQMMVVDMYHLARGEAMPPGGRRSAATPSVAEVDAGAAVNPATNEVAGEFKF